MKSANAMLMAAIIFSATPPLSAQDSSHPAILDFGRIVLSPDAANQPDPALQYRAVFNVTKASSDPAKVNPSLEKVARFINLLASKGVRPERGNIVAVVHGPATSSILTEEAYRGKFQVGNPNIPLLAALKAAGVEVHVCSQALAGQGLSRGAVAADVVVDLAGLTTLATLQLRGFALIPE